jgi:hypothetical protein
MKAILIGWNPETDEVMHQPCGSIIQAEELLESIASDFPVFNWVVLSDEEARLAHAALVVAAYDEQPTAPVSTDPCFECGYTEANGNTVLECGHTLCDNCLLIGEGFDHTCAQQSQTG